MTTWRSVLDVLVCPDCRSSVRESADGLSCHQCGRHFEQHGDAIAFRQTASDAEESYLGGVRGALRRSRFYPLLFRLFAPVLVTGPSPARRYGAMAESGVVIDLGAGNDRRHSAFLNIDILPYPSVDLICDAERLPLADESVDAVVCIVVLEHVPCMRSVVAEVARVLKPDGRFFVAVPFLQPFHAAPHDYRRWTIPGLREDLRPLHMTDSGTYGGPASSVSWLLAEFLALLLSLGSGRIRGWITLPLQAILSPIKWLDLLLVHHRGAHRLASTIWAEAKKS